MTKLVIVESPAKCKKIEKFLGPGYKCAASFGHIRDLDGGLKAIDISNNFEPSFKVLKAKMKYVTRLQTLVKNSTEVILATDDDREGEAIAWHLCKVFKLPVATTKRIIFHEITKDAIIKAVANPTRVDMNIVYAQQSRQILDIMVGFTISPILWKHISRNTKTGLSAGRCQTPALRIIYDRQKEIEENPGKKVYDTIGNFTKKNVEFKLNKFYDKEDDIEEFLVGSSEFEHVLSVSAPKIVIKKQPLPFTTSALQQKASNELNFSPKQTMKLAQTLYENGYITYMRTDSKTYSKEFIDKTKTFIKQRYGIEYIHSNIDSLSCGKGEKENKVENKEKKKTKKKTKKNESNAQEAHEAIRPTEIHREDLSDAIDSRGKRLYALIRRNTLESCMSEAEYYSITASISAPEKNIYRHTAELVKFPGWKIVNGYEKTNTIYSFLGKMKKQVVNYNKIYAKLTLKDLKTRYTEARLVQQLEKLGIGRPSTFSSIISKIQERKYVLKGNIEGKTHSCIDYQLIGTDLDEIEISRTFGAEKNKLCIQPIGIIVMEFLCKHFDALFMYDYTKNMEDDLDDVAKGNKTRKAVCHNCFTEINNLSSKIQKANRELIRIDDNHVYVIAKYGPVIKCDIDDITTWKKIKSGITLDDIRNKKLTIEDIVDVEKSFSGRNLGSFKNHDVVLKKGKFGLFVNWNSKNYSVGFLKKKESSIALEDIIDILSGKKSSNPNVLKIITDEITIRKGKFGPYIFYKTQTMKKPRFLKLKKFEWKTLPAAAILTWIKTEYNI
jgi:DNA topoisomerase-1